MATYVTNLEGNAASLVRALNVGEKAAKGLTDQYGKLYKPMKRVRTEAEKNSMASRSLARAQARELRASAALKEARIKGTIATKNATRAKNTYNRSSKEMRIVTGSLQRSLGVLRNQLLLVAFAYHTVQRFVLQNVKAWATFQKALMNIEVMMTDNIGPVMEQFRAQIEDLSVTYGRSAIALSKSMFDIYSATQDAALSLKILAAATRLSVAGGAELTVTTKALVTLMEAYGGNLESAEAAATLLFQTQVIARATMGELAGEVGKFLPLGAKLKIRNEELLAIYASLTRGIGDTSEAATSMRAILTALFKPSKELTKLVRTWKEGTLHNVIANKGLLYVLGKLSKVETENIGKMVRRVRGLIGVSVATADLNRVVEDANEILERNLTLNELVAKQMGTTEEKLKRLQARWQIFNIHLGEFIVTWHRIIIRVLAITAGLLVAAKFPAIIAGFIGMGKALGVAGLAAGSLSGSLKLLPGLGAAAFVGWNIGAIIKELTEVDKWLTEAFTGMFYMKQLKMGEAAKEWSKYLKKIKDEYKNTNAPLKAYLRATIDLKAMIEAGITPGEIYLQILRKYGRELGTIGVAATKVIKDFALVKEAAEKMLKGMEKNMADIFFDAFQRQLKSAGDYWRAFMSMMQRTFVDTLAKMLMEKWMLQKTFETVLGAMFPFLASPVKKHQGGVVRAHGGLAVDEVPIIAQTGERILSRRENQEYEQGRGLTIINVVDPSFVSAAIAQDPYTVVNIINEDTLRNRTTRRVMRMAL